MLDLNVCRYEMELHRQVDPRAVTSGRAVNHGGRPADSRAAAYLRRRRPPPKAVSFSHVLRSPPLQQMERVTLSYGACAATSSVIRQLGRSRSRSSRAACRMLTSQLILLLPHRRKLCIRWIPPHNLTYAQKLRRVGRRVKMMQRFAGGDSNTVHDVLTGTFNLHLRQAEQQTGQGQGKDGRPSGALPALSDRSVPTEPRPLLIRHVIMRRGGQTHSREPRS
ncbi:hypothetical protein EVAR_28708_1 [Eumeta japonica]|uniref:Uncharacterized protein n=1 Tax=Eumeta variegata TaxID=151549 RepID=A0A4C1V412_EUMVA|nr:hypothetical protein EVAR_28708_1 [Eumeta japonica]